MNFTLKIWRQKDAKSKGAFETYKVENISADTSFLEMLDILNNNLIHEALAAPNVKTSFLVSTLEARSIYSPLCVTFRMRVSYFCGR